MIIALALVAATIPLSSDSLRHRIVASLAEEMNADIELGDLDLHLFPRLSATGRSLRVKQHGNGDEPLISVDRFVVNADLAGLMRKRVAHLQLFGLKIVVPPSTREPERAEPIATSGQSAAGRDRPRTDLSFQRDVVVSVLESENAQLVIEPNAADRLKGKSPSIWTIHRLKMRDVGAHTTMPFDATLTNAVPPGEIVTSGTFGPWHVDDPGETPLNGAFTFARADLGVFHGVSGTLSSRGQFGGSLEYIDVNGETDTPDFAVTLGGQPFPLHATYHTIVDGTNGNTILKRIEASFLQSSLVASGTVYDEDETRPGRVVRLDVRMDRARIEDVLRMAVKSPKPPMTGALKLATTFLLPPGKSDVVDRLQLDGRFAIDAVRFANVDVQAKINELSHRSRGQSADSPRDGGVVSNFQGRFKLGGGRLTLPELTFQVPGTLVRLAGNYSLKPQTLDFHGTMLMSAKVSDTQTGVKHWLLKVVDPLFRRKDGKDGSALPLKITGRRSAPEFGLDYGRVFHR